MTQIKEWDELFMRHVYLYASKSKDCRTKIGAVLVKNNCVLTSTYNGFARLVKDLPERYENRELKRKIVCHAEANLIYISARLGINTSDSIVYTQGIPCCDCAKGLIQAAVSRVVVHAQWPNLVHAKEWIESIELSKMMFGEAGIEIQVFDKVLGVEGFLDGQVIKV